MLGTDPSLRLRYEQNRYPGLLLYCAVLWLQTRLISDVMRSTMTKTKTMATVNLSYAVNARMSFRRRGDLLPTQWPGCKPLDIYTSKYHTALDISNLRAILDLAKVGPVRRRRCCNDGYLVWVYR